MYGSDSIQPIAGESKGFHAFSNDISLKVNTIEQLKFELSSFEAALHCWILKEKL